MAEFLKKERFPSPWMEDFKIKKIEEVKRRETKNPLLKLIQYIAIKNEKKVYYLMSDEYTIRRGIYLKLTEDEFTRTSPKVGDKIITVPNVIGVEYLLERGA